MHRLIIIMICGLYASSVYSLAQTGEAQSLRVPLGASSSQQLSLDNRSTTPDTLSRLNYPLSDAFEIRRRIWNKVSRCETCHSLAFSFSNSYIPLLQGQHREYLYSKINAFKRNRLNRHPFPEFTQALSQDEIVDISLYYNIQKSLLDLKLVQFDANKMDEPAKQTESSIQACLDCHGGDGNGSGLIPDISGQSRNYLSYRIREIAEGSSRIHLTSDAPVSCDIDKVTIKQSKALAAQLSLVIDSTRLERGATVYTNHCQSCHENGDLGAPILNKEFRWTEKLLSGLNQYADFASRYRHRDLNEQTSERLSRNQWTDALHYVVSRSSQFKP